MDAVPWDSKAGACPLLMFAMPCTVKIAWFLSLKRLIHRRNGGFGPVIPYTGDTDYYKKSLKIHLPIFRHFQFLNIGP
jgi:hypothetical protein